MNLHGEIFDTLHILAASRFHSVGHGGQRRMGDISWVEFELQQIIC